MSEASAIDVLCYLVGATLLLGLIFTLLWIKIRGDREECDCPPTILKRQDGEGYTTKTFHTTLCTKKGTP